ncbi:MAG: hypothetical protein F2839_05260 [Actinobacteria bacterium]|nr:hypothetical protein [Actinomycetota bacterium]
MGDKAVGGGGVGGRKDSDPADSAPDALLTKIMDAVSTLSKSVSVLSTKMERMEKGENRSSRPSVTFESSTAGSGDAGSTRPHGEEFVDGGRFDFDAGESSVNEGRRSSVFSQRDVKDVGTKLERPKFSVKKSKVEDGFRREIVEDSDYLDYLDDYDHYFVEWKTIPANEGLSYSNQERVPIVNLPPKYARKIANRIKVIFDRAELLDCTVRQVQSAKFWKDMTSSKLREEIGKLVEREVSFKGACDLLRRIKFSSGYGPIDMTAFTIYQHEFKKELIRLRAGSRAPSAILLKDIIIAAYPDRMYQQELLAKFGSYGVLNSDPDDFAISLVFEDIETHITEITKQGLRAVVNKHLRSQESNFSSPKTPSSGNPMSGNAKFSGRVHHTMLSELFGPPDSEFWNQTDEEYQVDQVEEEHGEPHDSVEQQFDSSQQFDESDQGKWQFSVNSAITAAAKQKCLRPGKGPDGLLLCKFLGGTGSSCTFVHPEEDYKLKGRGFSSATPFKRL